ncbi:MAG: Small-conductance mechanosensitive channel [Candidatus Omnitrophica bacterium]|nr:Small-conductance mechanosensitive channel [Candidatus Omnitrophota bacterium]
MQEARTFMEKEIVMAQHALDLIVEYVVKYGLQALYGLLILFIGIKIGGWVERSVEKLCVKKHMDLTLAKFLAAGVKIVIVAFAGLITLEKFGITISPIIAAVSATIFGASFALQAPLSNYAAGLSIILTRPFTIGNTVTIQEYSGVVEEVKLPYTVLSTPSGERITIPNKHIVGEVLINSREVKMTETVVGISYGDDPERAIRIIQGVLAKFPAVLKTPGPQVGILEFGDSSINIQVRYWAPTKELVDLLHSVNLEIHKAFKAQSVTIPFPQRDVHIIGADSGAQSAVRV